MADLATIVADTAAEHADAASLRDVVKQLVTFHAWVEEQLGHVQTIGKALVAAALQGVLTALGGPAGASLAPALAAGMTRITEAGLARL